MASYQVRSVSPLRSLENSVKSDNAKLREKLANRRSILHQSDGRLRRHSSEGRYPSNPRQRSTSTLQRSVSTPQRTRYSEEGSSASSSYRSISRKRERKEAAEMKLKGLFSKPLSLTLSEDSGLDGGKSVFSNITILENTSGNGEKNTMAKGRQMPKKFERKVLPNVSSDEDTTMQIDSVSQNGTKNVSIKQHFSKQQHIQVFDCFIMIKM